MTSKNQKNNINRPIEKQFKIRNSLLTDVFKNDNNRTVYNLFVLSFLCIYVNQAVRDYLNHGEVLADLKLFKKSLDNVQAALLTWAAHFCMTCLVYLFFKIWAETRNYLRPQYTSLWDWSWLSTTVIYYIFSFVLIAYITTAFQLAFMSTVLVTYQQTVSFLKVHSFIRNNSPKVIGHKIHSDDKLTLPKFSSYFYFLCAPTFLYRDAYPRTEKINWKQACYHLLEAIAAMFIMTFVARTLIIPSVQDFGKVEYTVEKIFLRIIQNTIGGCVYLFAGFVFFLHSTPNLVAELTTFGDRFFYDDWWTCTDYYGWFQKWNTWVKDWLYCYIFKDCRDYIFIGNSVMAKFAVFVFSGVLHEWIASCLFGIFVPVCFLKMIFVAFPVCLLSLPKTAVLNLIFLFSLSFGMSIFCTTYSIEYFAKINAPLENYTFTDYLIPRFLSCIISK
jgi:sterol O-acyltransferase